MDKNQEVIIENTEICLALAEGGFAKSLVYKPTGQEFLYANFQLPFSAIVELRPYQNEIKLTYPNRRTVFKSNSLRMEEGKLIIGYELIPWIERF